LADAGDAPAESFLAKVYFQGLGVDRDGREARRLALAAAAEGDAESMRMLGNIFRYGQGIEADPQEAADWWRRGAEAGDSFSMMFYGNSLLRGDLVEPDRRAGIDWLRRAGEAENWWAMRDLARIYEEGYFGIARDASEAKRFRRLLAARGDSESQGRLMAQGESW
jgi:hypothetical protein